MIRARVVILIAAAWPLAGCGTAPPPEPPRLEVVKTAGGAAIVDVVAGRRRTLVASERGLSEPHRLAGGRIAYLKELADGATALHVSTKGREQRITFHPGSDAGLAVSPSGRLLFRSSESPGVLSVKWDGTGVWAWHEAHSGPPLTASRLRWDAACDSLIALAEDGSGWRIPARDHYRTRVALKAGEVPAAEEPRALPLFEPTSVNPVAKTGELFCMDARAGGGTAVRVHLPAFGGQSAVAPKDVPLARDGSFFVKLPPDRPVRLEVLDAGGRTVSAMTSHFWLRPGEQRGCIGCHESRGRAPANRLIEALESAPVEVTP